MTLPLLRVETREIDGGVSGPRQITVTFNDGWSGTYDYPAYGSGIDAHEECIAKLMDSATFARIESFYKVGETERGFKFTIFLSAAEET